MLFHNTIRKQALYPWYTQAFVVRTEIETEMPNGINDV